MKIIYDFIAKTNASEKCHRQTDRRTERGKPVHPLFWSDIMLSEEGIRI